MKPKTKHSTFKKSFIFLQSAITLLAVGAVMGADSGPVTTVYYEPEKVQPYVSYLKDNSRPPVDYVLKLFESYDLVILSERTHPEITQWDFIRELTFDPRFIERVGHIFTEYGSISQQESLEQLMTTPDLAKAEVDQRVIEILRNFPIHPHGWHNNNIFEYLGNLYELNQSLAVDKRVNLYFSDVPWQWKGKTKEEYQRYWKTEIPKRDQIMGKQITVKFREIMESNSRRKKALVIMNTRHAYHTGGHFLLGDSTADCLFREFPKATANVMLHTKAAQFKDVSGRTETHTLIQDGKWDAAYWMLGNSPAGFDFQDSPFGRDRFDLHSAYGGLNYEDVFTGMIFYQPLGSLLVASDIPGYYDEEFKQVVLKRARFKEKDEYNHIAGFLRSVKTEESALGTERKRNARPRWHKLEFKIGSRPTQPNVSIEFSPPAKVKLSTDEPLPSGQEVLQRSIQATGGRDVLAKIKNRVVKGTVEIFPIGVKSTITAYQARPNQYYAELVTDFDGTVITTEQGVDGEIAWELNPMTGPRILTGQEKDMMLQQSVFDETGYQLLYRRIACVGMEQVEGKVCYKVIQTPTQGEPITAYYSRESGLLAKSSVALEDQVGKTKNESLYSDYRKVDGVFYPHLVVQKGIDHEIRLRIKSIQHDVMMSENQFELPVAVKKVLQ